MSVITTADEKLSETKELIRQAISNLSEICIQECWGYDDFTSEYANKILKAMNDLIAIRRDLK